MLTLARAHVQFSPTSHHVKALDLGFRVKARDVSMVIDRAFESDGVCRHRGPAAFQSPPRLR